ncbi:hypothetical protein MATR_00880 [Marivirga tractuosa]|uniref:Uncharacterized protein n=1 Tax=Marivirga tractuosa (strain ATCC 23168 / DSM 4126 / NBRC 15989 / NCIMB 1408 / VKM B-1430 / H-43) TaxID=643867 RepID=E4TKW8_MARTH|nr:hypothetical protein Ftrac_2292 [Marivirga tractuosa DSM 4126]BDD13263.1 hypothetical protein MATR_00880 [Marivirga tractuosa]
MFSCILNKSDVFLNFDLKKQTKLKTDGRKAK